MEIVDSHRHYEAKIKELEDVVIKLDGFGYTKSLLENEIVKLREELLTLQTTRFQALESVTVATSSLGGHDYFVS